MSPALQPAEKIIELPQIIQNRDYVFLEILHNTASEVFRSSECRFSSSEEFMKLVSTRLYEKGIILLHPEHYIRDVVKWILLEI